ncbi:hypothetical protein N2382_09155 [SAR92 clade bacterium H921]|nr:hypothetical protein [SAR92 clade bacterium H921]
MNGVILSKPETPPVDIVDTLIQACKGKLAEQLLLTRTPDLDGFGCTAIEEKDGFTSIESYVKAVLAGMCTDHYLTTTAEGRPMAILSGALDKDGTFTVLVSLYNTDDNGSTAYVYEPDFIDEALISQYVELGCLRWLCGANRPQDLPPYLLEQGFVDVSQDEDDFRVLHGPFGW